MSTPTVTDFWATSDTHWFHKAIRRLCERPYDDIEEMNEALIEGWNGRVKPNDLVFHLGDVSFGKPAATVEVLNRLNGRIICLKGNHDSTLNDRRVVARFEKVVSYYEVLWNGRRIVMSHYPFAVWRDAHHGAWHLHGHCHGTYPHFGLPRMDVGVDPNGYVPVHVEEIAQVMADRKWQPVDHHG